jgi:hypothetical protein
MNMKKNGIFVLGGLALALVVVTAIYLALSGGERSPIYLKGNISLASGMEKEAEGIQTMYLILYDGETQWPAPFGVVRYIIDTPPKGKFFDFVVTKEVIQLMRQDHQLPKSWRVKVRLDKDGMAGQDQPGDLVGGLNSVAFGTEGVQLEIDRRI